MEVYSTPENAAWKQTCDELGLSYRQRRVSGALVRICVFHDEKTPSMWMYPDGNLYCYGCLKSTTVEEFPSEVAAGTRRRVEFEQWMTQQNELLGSVWDEPPF